LGAVVTVTLAELLPHAQGWQTTPRKRDALLVLGGHRELWLRCMARGEQLPEEHLEALGQALRVLGSRSSALKWHAARHYTDTCRIVGGLDDFVSWGGTPESGLAWLERLAAAKRASWQQRALVGMCAALARLGPMVDQALIDDDHDRMDELVWWAGWAQWDHRARGREGADCHERDEHGTPCGACYDCEIHAWCEEISDPSPNPRGGVAPWGKAWGWVLPVDTLSATLMELGNQWLMRRL